MRVFGENKKAEEIDLSNLPRHIAIILDGNGRWAQARGLPRTAGHAAGAETFRIVADHCRDLGLDYLTVYAFSTENWKRPPDEVAAIMGLLEKYFAEALRRMARENVRLRILGDTAALSPALQRQAAEINAVSDTLDGCQINLCLNYGGRDEILRAARAWAADPEAPPLTEDTFSRYLYTADIPDPDLIIRPSGEKRLSNFLLWQCAYTELYFTDVLWPDFSPRELDRAIADYQHRSRRYGGINA